MHYTIYIISGVSPTLFTAEKADPSKGATVSADTLDGVKAQIDNVLDFCKQIHINTYEGPDNSEVLQNINARVKSTAGEFDSLAIMIQTDYDFDVIIETFEHTPVRKSKKHSKHRKNINLIRILYRNKTIEYER